MALVKYSILMPYFDRLEQIRCTLTSFEHYYADRDDVEVIIVEDCKNNDGVASYISDYRNRMAARGIAFQLHYVKEADIIPVTDVSFWTACHLYNIAALKARGEYLLITNPEGLHKADILTGLDEEFSKNPNAYVICSCQAVGPVTFTDPGDFSSLHYETIKVDGSVWLQHSKYHHHMLNYCTVISARNYDKLHGFGMEFCAGYAFGDNDFRDRVIIEGLDIVNRDDLLTLHQCHPRFNSYVSEIDYRSLHTRNKEIYMELKAKRGHYTTLLTDRNPNATRKEIMG